MVLSNPCAPPCTGGALTVVTPNGNNSPGGVGSPLDRLAPPMAWGVSVHAVARSGKVSRPHQHFNHMVASGWLVAGFFTLYYSREN